MLFFYSLLRSLSPSFYVSLDIMKSYEHFVFSIHPPPAFGSSPNLEALALQASKSEVQDDSGVDAIAKFPRYALLRCSASDLVGANKCSTFDFYQ